MDTSMYDEVWFRYLRRFDKHLEGAVLGVFALLGIPETLMDVGCGTGHTVEFSSRLGIHADGIEVSVDHLPKTGNYFEADLTENNWVPGSYDLVFCLEVAEHLPEESADTLVQTLSELTSGFLIFSAAHKGQGGDFHLNEQDFDPYWKIKLQWLGFEHDPDLSMRLKNIWTYCTGPMHWLPENVEVLRR